MPVIIPTFKNDSKNKVLPEANYESLAIPVNVDSYSTDFQDATSLFFIKRNFSGLSLEINNTGDSSIDYDISGKIATPDNSEAIDETWSEVETETLTSKSNKIVFINEAYCYILVRLKETVSGSDSVVNFYLRAVN